MLAVHVSIGVVHGQNNPVVVLRQGLQIGIRGGQEFVEEIRGSRGGDPLTSVCGGLDEDGLVAGFLGQFQCPHWTILDRTADRLVCQDVGVLDEELIHPGHNLLEGVVGLPLHFPLGAGLDGLGLFLVNQALNVLHEQRPLEFVGSQEAFEGLLVLRSDHNVDRHVDFVHSLPVVGGLGEQLGKGGEGSLLILILDEHAVDTAAVESLLDSSERGCHKEEEQETDFKRHFHARHREPMDTEWVRRGVKVFIGHDTSGSYLIVGGGLSVERNKLD